MLTTLAERKKLLQSFPCFSTLTAEEFAELSALMQEVKFAPNEMIVQEHDFVDSIFIIIYGEAEVSKIAYRRGKKRKKPEILALLRKGDSIGLDDTGYYSKTGERTATVTALTEMLLLRLAVKDLYKFLKVHHLNHAMYAASEQMLRIRFIKRSLPFARLSTQRLKWLSERVEEKFYPAGSVIFNQGEHGDSCYLVRSGEVEILILEENGENRRIALLKPTVLFGEATLLTRSARNATAVAVTDCILFALQNDHLSELLETEKNVANMFMTLMVDRSLPSRNPNVVSHLRVTADGQEITVLKNMENNSYFNLSSEGAFIWKQLNGRQTMQDITLALAEEYHVFAPDMVAALIAKLTRYGFIANLRYYIDTSKGRKPLWYKGVQLLRAFFSKRFAFGHADSWLSEVYQRYIHYLFTLPGQIILATIIIVGFTTFLGYTDDVLDFFADKNENLYLLLLLIPLSLFSIFMHELGHAFAVKACGREVHFIGIGWNWFIPVAFIDTSDMWLASRKQRLIVNIAGVYIDALIAGLCGLSIMLFSSLYVQGMLWVFALYTYVRGFRMLTPFQDMDGYYLLMDGAEKPKLRRSSVIWLLKKFSRSERKPLKGKYHWPEIAYWLGCFVFLLCELLIVFLIQACALTIFGIEFSNPYSSMIIPVLVVVASSLSIVVDIRHQAEEWYV